MITIKKDREHSQAEYDEAQDVSYDDISQNDYDEAAQPDYDDFNQAYEGDDVADPDGGSQEWQARKQK